MAAKTPFWPSETSVLSVEPREQFQSRMLEIKCQIPILTHEARRVNHSCTIHSISATSWLRLLTSSLRKIAWRCFFTIAKLKQAAAAIQNLGRNRRGRFRSSRVLGSFFPHCAELARGSVLINRL